MRELAWGSVMTWVIVASLGAQEPSNPHQVQPERPTVATHAHTVAPGWVELETGIELDRLRGGDRTFSTPSNLKIGLGERVQLGILGGLVRNTGNGVARTGPSDVTFAVKWRLADSLPVVGAFAVLPALKLPTGSVTRGTGTGTTDVGLTLISSHDIGALALDVNLGYTRRSGTGANAPRNAMLWTVSTGFSIAGGLGWAAEVFGYPGTSGPAGAAPIVALLLGPTLEPRPWLALDTGFVIPIAGPQARVVYAGAVWNAGRLP